MSLAPYHLSVKTVSRGKGRSATAACAYRSGERIEDQRTGQVFDYSRRGGVERAQCEIFAPENAPAWARDRPALWNEAEAAETRKNSTVAREFEIALPADLDEGERRELVRRFAGALVERHRLVVDASIHSPDADAGKGQGNRNHHAHVLCTTRRIEANGFGAKTRELDDQRSGEVEHWREGFAAMCGDALERAGFTEQAARWRAGHLDKAGQIGAAQERGDEAFIAENKDRVPTKHYGPNVIQIERKGVVTERGEKAREPERLNAEVIDLAAARARIAAEPTQPESTRPGLLDVPLPAASRPPEVVLREWRGEVDRQFGAVRGKAERVDRYARRLLHGHRQRRDRHQQHRPAKPGGVFAGMKRGTYDVAVKAWEATRAAIQKRIDRLASQIERLTGYMRRSAPGSEQPTAGERLAEKKAVTASPELATEARGAFRQANMDEWARLGRDTQHRQEGQAMTDGTRGTTDAGEARQHREAEQRARLERDGKLAQRQNETLDQEKAEATASKPAQAKDGQQPETDQERKVREAREAIRRQRGAEREDRDRTRGRGR